MNYRTFTVDFGGRTVAFRYYLVREHHWRFDMWCGWLEEWRFVCMSWTASRGLVDCYCLDFDEFFQNSLKGLPC